MYARHVYDNVGQIKTKHIYENPGELRDATPDLILAVKPKVPLEHGEEVCKLLVFNVLNVEVYIENSTIK